MALVWLGPDRPIMPLTGRSIVPMSGLTASAQMGLTAYWADASWARMWFACLAAALGVWCLGNAIHAGGKACISSWVEAFAMMLLVITQGLTVRKQGEPPVK